MLKERIHSRRIFTSYYHSTNICKMYISSYLKKIHSPVRKKLKLLPIFAILGVNKEFKSTRKIKKWAINKSFLF